MELRGLEPPAPCLQTTGTTSTRVHSRRSPSPDVRPGPPRSAPVAVLSCCTHPAGSPAAQERCGTACCVSRPPPSAARSDRRPEVPVTDLILLFCRDEVDVCRSSSRTIQPQLSNLITNIYLPAFYRCRRSDDDRLKTDASVGLRPIQTDASSDKLCPSRTRRRDQRALAAISPAGSPEVRSEIITLSINVDKSTWAEVIIISNP